MADHLSLLSFSILPFLLVSVTSISLAPAGAMLSLKSEIMLALALPSIANAGISLGLFCGVHSDQTILLYLFATCTTFSAIAINERIKTINQKPEMFPAFLFSSGQIIAILLSSVSQEAHSHSAHLLNGELLATDALETFTITTIFIVLFFSGFYFRSFLYCWCGDNDFFRTKSTRHNLISILLYSSTGLLITIATATIGTLLTTAMLIIPAYLGDVRKGGVDRYFLTVILIGISGSVSGFITALIFDLPPAVCAAGGVGITGLIANRLSSNKFRN